MTTSCSKAWVRGYNAGCCHRDITDNPYTVLDNFDEHFEWLDAYYEAQTDAVIGD